MTNQEKLIDILTQNPNLPLVFFTSDDDLSGYAYTLRTNFNVEVASIWEVNETVYTCRGDAFEILCDELQDSEEYAKLSDEEFEKVINEKVDMLPHYDAIIVWVYT